MAKNWGITDPNSIRALNAFKAQLSKNDKIIKIDSINREQVDENTFNYQIKGTISLNKSDPATCTVNLVENPNSSPRFDPSFGMSCVL